MDVIIPRFSTNLRIKKIDFNHLECTDKTIILTVMSKAFCSTNKVMILTKA